MTDESGTARGRSLDENTVQRFRTSLHGELIQRGAANGDYELARKVWNGMIDRHPELIARCADSNDVVAAVNFAREHDLPLAIRGGSHNVTGNAVCDDGLVIDLSGMKRIEIDREARRVRAAGGCTWGDVDRATHEVGLAVPGGVISTTGIAGLTLGGGLGYLTRKWGLSCDNLISAEVVTADGRLVTASADKNSDLFWGLRGGGGNFGVVTSFEFDAHPVSTILGGPILYPLDKAREALRFYRDFMDQAPDDVNAFFAFLIVPPAPPFPEHLHNTTQCGVVVCCTAALDKAQELVKPLREFGPPLVDFIGEVPFPALNSMFDPLLPEGLLNYWKADFMDELSDEAIEVHVKYGPRVPTMNSAIHIYPVSGAANRKAPGDTAYHYRKAKFVHVLAAVYPDPADTEKNVAYVREYWSALHPHSSGGAYVNFMMDEGEDRIRATYRGNYDRLLALKRKYDPNNLFHFNQNIDPVS
jgi:FAD/FMN-containing dehydrogenase